MTSTVISIRPVFGGDTPPTRPTDLTQQAFVYVIGAEDGPQKIGISRDTIRRLRVLQTASHAILLVAGHAPCNWTEARRIEAIAHFNLAPRRLAGEWFSVTPAEALAAVEAAAGGPTCMPPLSSYAGRLCKSGISAKQIKAARVFLDWEQRDLAEKSGLSLPTIQRMEKLGVERSSVANAGKLQAAFEAAGVEFIPANGGGPGVRLREPEA